VNRASLSRLPALILSVSHATVTYFILIRG
jgi:hypothetical protein